MKILKSILFWILQCTWGILMTIPGAIYALVCVCLKRDHMLCGYSVMFIYGKNWGNLTLGPFTFTDPQHCEQETLCYSAGRQIQNAIFGPFFILLIGIPSIIRWGLFKYRLAWNRCVLALLVTLIPAIISIGLIVLAVFINNAILGIVFGAVLLYDLLLCVWLFCPKIGELSRLKNDKTYIYNPDSIWFERNALLLGFKFYGVPEEE